MITVKAHRLQRALAIILIAAGVTISGFSTTLKNPLRESIVMANGKTIKKEVTADEVLVSMRTLASGGLDAGGKQALLEKIDRIGDREWGTLSKKLDGFAKPSVYVAEEDKLLARLLANFKGYPKDYSLSGFCTALFETHEAVKTADFVTPIKKYGRAFVNAVLLEAYFKQGRFKEFTDALTKKEGYYTPFQILFNEFVKSDGGFGTQLRFWGYSQELKVTGTLDDATKKAIGALNAYLKITGDALTLDTIKELGRRKGITETSGLVIATKVEGEGVGAIKVEKITDSTKLPEALKEFYNQHLNEWVNARIKEDYKILDVRGLVDYVMGEVRQGRVKTPIPATWLSDRLREGKLKQYLEKKVTFNAEEIAKRIASPTTIYDAQDARSKLGLERPIDIGAKTDDPVELERIKTAKVILDSFRADTGFKGYLTDKKIKEPTVKDLQDFLYNYAISDNGTGFREALKQMKMAPTDIKASGKLDITTADACAVYKLVANGKWVAPSVKKGADDTLLPF